MCTAQVLPAVVASMYAVYHGSDQLKKIAERIRASVRSQPYLHETGNIPLSVSIGISTLRSSDEDYNQILQRADEALYLAKDNGRNRVETKP